MPNPVDVHVGQSIRNLRLLHGVTLMRLAEQVDVRFQQIQKYENGQNRVCASRLWDIANALNEPISRFFDGLPDKGHKLAETPPVPLLDKEGADLARRFVALSEAQRESLLGLALVMAQTG